MRGRYANRKVTYFRVFDPASAAQRSLNMQRYDDFDVFPDLILRSGHVEDDGSVVLTRPAIVRTAETPSRTSADRTLHADDAHIVRGETGASPPRLLSHHRARAGVMNITDVTWTRDHHGKPVLQLQMDGHPAYIRSSQKTALTDRGIVDGMVFLDSERASQDPSAYLQGDRGHDGAGLDLVGCTDDPQVFALYQTMCAAIRTDRWSAGAQTPTS